MDLAEAGGDIGSGHFFRLGHRGLGVFASPRIRAQMIAAEDDVVLRQLLLRCDTMDELDEILRQHAGIATELVDLVAGGLDQQRAGHAGGVSRGSPDDQWVC
jgi:hypothetical protein